MPQSSISFLSEPVAPAPTYHEPGPLNLIIQNAWAATSEQFYTLVRSALETDGIGPALYYRLCLMTWHTVMNTTLPFDLSPVVAAELEWLGSVGNESAGQIVAWCKEPGLSLFFKSGLALRLEVGSPQFADDGRLTLWRWPVPAGG